MSKGNAKAACASLFLAMLAGQAVAAEPLRFCADPANLPFSSNDPKTPGLYVEIGQAIGAALGRPVAFVWNVTYFGKHTIRTTLLSGQCDAMIGLPDDADFMGPKVIFSKPFAAIGYALVVPKGKPAGSLDDLAGKRVAVQLSTTPQNMLAERPDIQMVTVREPEDAMTALGAGDVDAAFIWGPVAGYVNQTTFSGRFEVVPVEGAGLRWQTAIGFARGNQALRDQVDQVLDSATQAVISLETKYGVPAQTPIRLTQGRLDGRIQLAAAEPTTATDAAPAAAPAAGEAPPAAPATGEEPAASSSGDAAVTPAAAGKELFDGTCAHCHGPDAVTSERRINLRLLSHRYKDKMDETFYTTVNNGRPEKGMPSWNGIFTDDQFAEILAFLHTVQTP